MSEELSLQDAADILDVHYMTAYRYVRLGLLNATKVGGTWRVKRSDLDAFREGSSKDHSNEGESRKKSAPWSERLELRLLAGDARGAWGVVEAALAAGADLDDVARRHQSRQDPQRGPAAGQDRHAADLRRAGAGVEQDVVLRHETLGELPGGAKRRECACIQIHAGRLARPRQSWRGNPGTVSDVCWVEGSCQARV